MISHILSLKSSGRFPLLFCGPWYFRKRCRCQVWWVWSSHSQRSWPFALRLDAQGWWSDGPGISDGDWTAMGNHMKSTMGDSSLAKTTSLYCIYCRWEKRVHPFSIAMLIMLVCRISSMKSQSRIKSGCRSSGKRKVTRCPVLALRWVDHNLRVLDS